MQPRGIITTIATLVLSSSVGRWCDTHPSRLQTLRITIFLQRTCVVLACLGWFFIVGEEFLGGGFLSVVQAPTGKGSQGGILDGNRLAKAAVMVAVMVLGIGERLSAVGNMIVMERDWVCNPSEAQYYNYLSLFPRSSEFPPAKSRRPGKSF